MKANIEISEETMNRLSGALDLSPLYDEDYGVDEENLSYAIKLMVDLCADQKEKIISMIMINGNWEQVKDLSDVLRIVSENIGDEFANKVEEIIKYDYEYIGDE